MKISEMTNEQAADALVKITVPLGNICEDEETVNLFKKWNDEKGIPVVQMIGKILPQAVAHLMKTHRDDLYEIIGALAFQTKEQVAKMNFFSTVNLVKDSYDEVLLSFFPSYVEQMKKSAGK